MLILACPKCNRVYLAQEVRPCMCGYIAPKPADEYIKDLKDALAHQKEVARCYKDDLAAMSIEYRKGLRRKI